VAISAFGNINNALKSKFNINWGYGIDKLLLAAAFAVFCKVLLNNSVMSVFVEDRNAKFSMILWSTGIS
jgi:hypothetical protein